MTHLLIESDANPRVKRWKRLAADARFLRREGALLIEGIHLAEVVLEHPDVKVSAVILSGGRSTNEAAGLADKLADAKGAKVYVLSDRLYDSISPVENGVGIMCEVEIPEVPSDDAWRSLDALYLDGVQDSGNAGTLIRSAAAAGVRVVITSPGAACLWTPKVLRAGMGAHFSVMILEGCPVRQLRERYAGRLLAADARGGENLFLAPDYTARGPICWMMGAEGPGLSDEALAATDERYWIPIAEGVESLNVAAAAAVCLFDSSRRRLLRDAGTP